MTAVVNWGDPRLPDRFWDKVSPCPTSGCWWWTGSSRQADGSGPTFAHEGENSSVRRVVFGLFIGDIAPSKRVRSTCDEGCCNPAHLLGADKTSTDRKLRYQREYGREWNRRNPTAKRRSQLKQAYGISLEVFDAMLLAQGNACAICRRSFDSSKRRSDIRVDHDHETGRVRDLLCHPCNVALGIFGDALATLRAAADYVERHKECR